MGAGLLVDSRWLQSIGLLCGPPLRTSFDNDNGSIVQCADDMWSHAGARSGARSDHGIETGYAP
jgi:hypothetical protein